MLFSVEIIVLPYTVFYIGTLNFLESFSKITLYLLLLLKQKVNAYEFKLKKFGTVTRFVQIVSELK